MIVDKSNGTTSSSAEGAARRPGAFATRRRLIVAFSLVLLAFVPALAAQLMALRKMEVTVECMKDHEEQTRLALDLVNAVRDQHEHQEQFAMGKPGALREYERARERAQAAAERLRERLDEPAAVVWLDEILVAAGQIDEGFRQHVTPTLRGAGGSMIDEHVRAYRLVADIQEDIDSIIGLLQETSSQFREQLVTLETAFFRWTAVLLFASPLFMAGVVLYLSRSVARPLARLSEGATAVARGDLDSRIEIDTPDEFGALAQEFNAMTVALRQHQERLVEAEKLAGIGRLAAGVAHEINNPLQVMLGYLSLNRDHPDRRLREHLEAVEAEALRCKQVVDGLIELSRPSVKPTPVDLRALCDDVADRLRVSVLPRGSRLEIAGEGSALGCSSKLRQVLFNLVKNASEAAGRDGRIEVHIAETDAGHVEVSVSDSGPGVPPELRARLFEPFFTTKPSGTGLGLAVSRAIALAHGGDIEVRSGHLGGATFTLRLTSAAVANREEAA